jgi:hypothetical protein
MPIARLKTQQLTAGERTDLEAALRDPARFHSDGKEVGLAAIILPLLLLPLEVVLVNEMRSVSPLEVFDHFFDFFPWSLSILWHGDFLLLVGVVVIPVAIVVIALYGIRARGRHGHAITSFGVVRIRGNMLRVLRYADMVETKIEERRRPQFQVITDELELRAKDGGSLVLYGFGLEERKALIDAHVSALARPFRGA